MRQFWKVARHQPSKRVLVQRELEKSDLGVS
jgi:hypothetical protein